KKRPKPTSKKQRKIVDLSLALQVSRSLSPISIKGGLDIFRASKDCIVKALSLSDSSILCRSTLSSLPRSYNQTFLLCKLWIWR
ncbi:hypothetical protein GIB67_017015, partial [Kingdonia uniflora]